MNFIFFGRLAKEKGFDLIVRALFDIVEKTGELPGNISIFGEGDLRELLFETFEKTSLVEDCSKFTREEIEQKIESFENSEVQKIYFFGWQSQEAIREVLGASHFSLMPSRFLETFGLSALESLSEGVPVIGFRKGGLMSFIHESLAVPFSSDDEVNIRALSETISRIAQEYFSGNEADWSELSHKSIRIADSYTEGRWIRQVQEIFPEGAKRILLASDYTTLLGGIETHVQTIAKALRHEGYEVEIFGWDIPKGRWTKVLRLGGLVYSLCNITSALALRKKIGGYSPDVIWLHSVSRFLGPLAVREVDKSNILSLVTYHDLGLLSPFPSRVEDEDMIPSHPGLAAFISVLRSLNPIVYLATYCKYFQVFVLRKLLQGMDVHIAPSTFLARHIHNVVEVPSEKIVTLEHFL